jgi:hypothetical protein
LQLFKFSDRMCGNSPMDDVDPKSLMRLDATLTFCSLGNCRSIDSTSFQSDSKLPARSIPLKCPNSSISNCSSLLHGPEIPNIRSEISSTTSSCCLFLILISPQNSIALSLPPAVRATCGRMLSGATNSAPGLTYLDLINSGDNATPTSTLDNRKNDPCVGPHLKCLTS